MANVNSIFGTFNSNTKLISDAIRGIRSVEDGAIDETILAEDRVVLELSSEEGFRVTLSLGGAFTAVMVPATYTDPVTLVSALPTSKNLKTLQFHPNGHVTEADGKTVIDRNKQEERNTLIAVVRGVQEELNRRLKLE